MVMFRWLRLVEPGKVVWTAVMVTLLHMCIFWLSPGKLIEVSPTTLSYHLIPLGSMSFFAEELQPMIIARNDTGDKLSLYSAPVDIVQSKKIANLFMNKSPHRMHNFQGKQAGGLYTYFHNSYHRSEEVQLRETLEELLDMLSVPTYHCKKLLRMGGFYCNHKPDGEKHVCHDPNLYPDNDYCMVYSFGVGHDFTFDMQIDKFGCQVFAFDSDLYHSHYPTYITERLTFYKVRVGTYFLKATQYQLHDMAAGPFVVEYWPIPAIMAKLGHTHHQLHYLKLDIEGDEWTVLEKSLFQTDILEGTQQLALEVHLDDLRHGGGYLSLHSLLTCVARYLRILHGLNSRGFLLAHWEPNYKGSELTTLAGLTFHVFSETLWVNPGYQRRRNNPTKGQPPPQL
ncbi:uncharacterized protein [Panulirus ornatus]|uniref:uncharacterized protein n=1 Tax=Panulirus ornatus TaxID=150431 RepID=UPI003A860B48